MLRAVWQACCVGSGWLGGHRLVAGLLGGAVWFVGGAVGGGVERGAGGRG